VINSLLNSTSCPACNNKLFFSYTDTLNAYKDSTDMSVSDIIKEIDLIMDEYLVFVCNRCNSKYRYTYKDIHRAMRIDIFKKLLRSKVQGQAILLNANKDKVMVFCGKCVGYDGKGGCPITMFVKCEIKKFPME